jgi:hypothetical protein
MVYRRQTRALSRVVEASSLMVPEREVPVAPFHVRAGALAHVSQLGRLCLQRTLLSEAQVTQGPTGLKERSAHALRQRPQRLACGDRPGRGHAIERECGNELGMHGVGHGRRQVHLPHLLVHIPRDKLDGGLPFGHHALGFRDPLQACLTEVCVLGDGADCADVALDIPGNELAMATHTALQVDKVVSVPDGTDALP